VCAADVWSVTSAGAVVCAPAAVKTLLPARKEAGGSVVPARHGEVLTPAAAAEIVPHTAIPPHPFLAQATAVVRRGSRTHVLFPLAAGDLFGVLGRHVDVPPPAMWRAWCWQLLSALAHLHGHGFWHRDIKMENTLISADGDAWLADLGLVRAETLPQLGADPLSEGAATAHVGSLLTRAWELLAPPQPGECPTADGTRRQYTAAVDVWSMGVVLCALASGGYHAPFDDDAGGRALFDSAPTSAKIVDLLLAGHANPEPAAREVLEGMLTRDPDARWSARAALDSEWLAGMTAAEARAASAAHAAWWQPPPPKLQLRPARTVRAPPTRGRLPPAATLWMRNTAEPMPPETPQETPQETQNKAEPSARPVAGRTWLRMWAGALRAEVDLPMACAWDAIQLAATARAATALDAVAAFQLCSKLLTLRPLEPCDARRWLHLRAQPHALPVADVFRAEITTLLRSGGAVLRPRSSRLAAHLAAHPASTRTAMQAWAVLVVVGTPAAAADPARVLAAAAGLHAALAPWRRLEREPGNDDVVETTVDGAWWGARAPLEQDALRAARNPAIRRDWAVIVSALHGAHLSRHRHHRKRQQDAFCDAVAGQLRPVLDWLCDACPAQSAPTLTTARDMDREPDCPLASTEYEASLFLESDSLTPHPVCVRIITRSGAPTSAAVVVRPPTFPALLGPVADAASQLVYACTVDFGAGSMQLWFGGAPAAGGPWTSASLPTPLRFLCPTTALLTVPETAAAADAGTWWATEVVPALLAPRGIAEGDALLAGVVRRRGSSVGLSSAARAADVAVPRLKRVHDAEEDDAGSTSGHSSGSGGGGSSRSDSVDSANSDGELEDDAEEPEEEEDDEDDDDEDDNGDGGGSDVFRSSSARTSRKISRSSSSRGRSATAAARRGSGRRAVAARRGGGAAGRSGGGASAGRGGAPAAGPSAAKKQRLEGTTDASTSSLAPW